jgi:ABC-type transport system substrate-binding protein
MALYVAASRLAVVGLVLAFGVGSCNSPYPESDDGKSIFYTTFTEEPKHLDPARSYSTDESGILCQILQPPFHYHFLKRPYELEPLTAEAMPKPTQRQVRFDGKTVEATVYTIRIKQGIRYHDHPCFVEANRRLTRAQVRHATSVWDIKPAATRELVAGDYVHAMRRLCDPRLACPVFSTLAENTLGMAEYQKTLQEKLVQRREERKAAAGLLYNQEQDEKYNPIALDYAEGAEQFPFIREVDRYTFEIVLREPYPQILYWMAMAFFSPVPPEAIEFYNQGPVLERSIVFDKNPVGTGAYVMQEFDPTNQIVLARNTNYHDDRYPSLAPPPPGDSLAQTNYDEMKAAGMLDDAGKKLPFIEKIVMRMEKESVPRWNKFLQGYYDSSGISSDVFDQAVSLSSKGDSVLSDDMAALGIRMITSYSTATHYSGFNMNDPVFGGYTPDKCKLRQAVSIAFDIEEEVAVFANGRAVCAHSPIPPGIFGFDQGEAGINPIVYRWDEARKAPVRRSLEEAKKLLAEAGYPNGYGSDGRQLTIKLITTAPTPESRTRLDFVRKQFDKLNIRLELDITDYNQFRTRTDAGNFQFVTWGWVADYPDPENFLFLLYGPNSKTVSGNENVVNYQNPKFDELFAKMRSMENTPERLELIRKMVAILREDSPWIFGYHPIAYDLYHGWLKNNLPHAIAFNTLKYRRIEVEKRTEFRRRHNRPEWWPVIAAGLLVLVSGVPAMRAAMRHFQEA